VTRADDGRVLEIDGRPAREFVAPYLDGAGPSAFGNPLAVSEPGMTEHYLRVILGVDDATGAIMTPGSVPVGATIQLASTTSERLIDAVGDAVRRANDAFPTGARPEAALIFSCAVRRFLLGSRTSIEIEEAKSGLPSQIPVAGMYCLGEIAPIKGSAGSRLLNESFVTVLLGG
jgi:hypothetical protein